MVIKNTKCYGANLSLLSPQGQRMLIEKCVPKDCIPEDWTCDDNNILKNIQSLLDKSGTKFDHIESAEKFAIDLDWAVSFPGNHEYFGLGDTEIFKPLTILYPCGDGDYHYKKSMYQVLPNFIVNGSLSRESERFGLSVIYTFVNIKSKKLPVSSELYHTNHLHKTAKAMTIIGNMFENDGWERFVPKDIDFRNPETAFTAFYNLVELEKDDEIVRSKLSEQMEKLSIKLPIATRSSEYQKIYVWIYLILNHFKKVASGNPLAALPRSETVDTIQREKIPIRIFTFNHTRFVIAREFLHTLKTEKLDVSRFENEILGFHKNATICVEEIPEILSPEVFERIVFIRTEVMIRGLGPAPTPAFEGGYFLMITDFLKGTLYNLIDQKKVFYGMKSTQQGMMEGFFSGFQNLLADELNFVSLDDVKHFNAEIDDWHKNNFPTPDRLEIRQTSRFRLKDLRNELKHLELLEIFPNIFDHTETVYNQKVYGNGWSFNTSYMHELVRKCQIRSLVASFPKFSEFMQNAKYSDVLLFFEESIPEGDKNLEQSDVEPSDPPIAVDTLPDDDTTGSESLISIEKANEHAINEKPKKKKPKVIEKESQVCPKCSRGSEITRKLNEKLKSEKSANKALKKQVVKFETQAVEFKTEMEEFRTKVEELETEKGEWKQRELEMMAEIQRLNQKVESANLESSAKVDIVGTVVGEQQSVVEGKTFAETWREEEEEKEHVLSEAEVKKQQPEVVAEELTEANKKEDEEEEKKKNLLLKYDLLEMTIRMENPLEKVEELTNEACNKTNYKRAKQFLKQEKELFSKSCQSYIDILRSNIEMIHKDEFNLTPLAEFPSLSKKFVDVYKRVMQCKPPVICESLLKKQDDGLEANAYAVPVENPETDLKDCLICFEDLTPEDDIVQCWKCKRHCHKNGLMEWFKVKRTCPLCSAVALDEEEYPALS